MRAAGVFVALASLAGAAHLVWLFHLFTFGSPNHAYMFESEPPEGWEFWERKLFWENFWPFVTYTSITVATGLIPIVALLFSTPQGSKRLTFAIAVLGVILALPPGFMTLMSVARQNIRFFSWAPPLLFVGCVYSVIRSTAMLQKNQREQNEDAKASPRIS